MTLWIILAVGFIVGAGWYLAHLISEDNYHRRDRRRD